MLGIHTFRKSYFPPGKREFYRYSLAFLIGFCFVLTCTPPCFGEPPSSASPEDSNYWFQNAEASLRQKLMNQKINTKKAKNVIFVIGHGMGISTLTASRIYKGQKEGMKFGEEANFTMEQLQNAALSKTFCLDSQVPDSACSAHAYLCGTLGNALTVGLTSNVQFGDCAGQQNKSNHLTSVLAWAKYRGMSTGIVVNTRVTHSIVAATYAHSANTAWESDTKVTDSGENSETCDDIAEQLINGEVGKYINVILGGGRNELTPTTVLDVETNQPGHRTDGKNLIESWLQSKPPQSAKYVWNKEQLLNVDTAKTDYLLGLFSYSNMDYVSDAERNGDPSLAEMTKVAIDILSKNPNGYFLFVEGGRIDQALHECKAQKAFLEVIALDDAVSTAMKNSYEEDTLLIVSADHSNVLTISGYPPRGNPILGFAGISDVDARPYTTISFANGPGYKRPEANGERYNLTNDPLFDIQYTQMTGLPLIEETHGGEDVSTFSRGPWSHLLTGVNHQSFIPHVIAYAACLDIPGRSYLKGAHCYSTSTSYVNSRSDQ